MKDTIDKIVERNEPEFNYLKLLEELAELTEVLIKRYLKIEKYKPSMSKVTDEIGDVLIRLRVFGRKEGLGDAVEKRIKSKLAKLEGYFDTNEFKNI